MTYDEALKYLDSFIDYERAASYNYKESLKLERMSGLAESLGNPHKGIKAIHIAGSKGKGSTASFTYSILKKSGFKVGLYTSPHLVSFRERIRINDEFISADDISRLLESVRGVVSEIDREKMPSFFEIYTALAFLYFKEKKVDYAVYETGLGGRLDGTNVVEPVVAAITPISYEHTDKLGNTLSQIAEEKAGIVKKNTPCVSAPQDPEALRVITRICGQKNSKLILIGKDIKFKELRSDSLYERFDVYGLSGEYLNLRSPLLGSHQVINAATAIGIAEMLNRAGSVIDKKGITRGIAETVWEGRFQIVEKNPRIILDGAQNRASANALVSTIRKIFATRYGKLILVLGVSKDKDLAGMLEEFLPVADSLILTKSKVAERALEPSRIRESVFNVRARIFNMPGKEEMMLTSDVRTAVAGARKMASKNDIIVITGSLFVVGEAMEVLGVR